MAFDAFLKMDGILGDSRDAQHKGDIDVMTFSFGIARKKPGGHPEVSEVTIVKLLDSASPQLFEKACQGEPIDFAMLVARKAGGKNEEFLKIKFEDVNITALHPGSSPGTDFPMESLSFNFAKIEYEFIPQKPDGSPGPPIKSSCSSRKPRSLPE